MKYFINIFFSLVIFESAAQNSFGFEFGTYFHTYQGINDFDSIRVLVDDSDRGEMFGGFFYEKNIKDRFVLHSKLFIRPIYIDNIVFNNSEQCQLFCRVKKSTLSSVTNLSLELLPQFELFKISGLKVKVFGGGNTSFNFHLNQPEISFNGRHPGVALVMNSLDDVVKPISFSWVYGVSLEYNRLIFWVKNQHRSNYSKEIEISNENYSFNNTWRLISFSIGYRFYSLKRGSDNH